MGHCGGGMGHCGGGIGHCGGGIGNGGVSNLDEHTMRLFKLRVSIIMTVGYDIPFSQSVSLQFQMVKIIACSA